MADTLSRFVVKGVNKEKSCPDDLKQVDMLRFEKKFNLKKHVKQLRFDQEKEEWIKNIVAILKNQVDGDEQSVNRIKKWYLIHDGLLFRRGGQHNSCFRLCVLQNQVVELVHWQHDKLGHFGKTKTFQYMKDFFYWPKMSKHIRQVVATYVKKLSVQLPIMVLYIQS